LRDPLSDLAETLLRAGIAPGQVRRYLGELREHLEDLTEHLERDGLSPEAAASAARERLGDTGMLALPMLVQPRFHSWTARLPALFYVALPFLSQILASALLIVGLNIAATTLELPGALRDLGSAVSLAWLALPVAFAWLVLPAAYRRRARLLHPLIGVAAGATLAASLQLRLTLPADGESGLIAVALVTPSLLPLLVLFTLGLLPLAAFRLLGTLP